MEALLSSHLPGLPLPGCRWIRCTTTGSVRRPPAGELPLPTEVGTVPYHRNLGCVPSLQVYRAGTSKSQDHPVEPKPLESALGTLTNAHQAQSLRKAHQAPSFSSVHVPVPAFRLQKHLIHRVVPGGSDSSGICISIFWSSLA